MKRQAKSFIALSLTFSLASVSTLSEVSKANEMSEIQEEGLSLLSTEIDEAMQRVQVDQSLMDDFSFTILEQPDIVGLEVMEDLHTHQQTMREDANTYLKEIKPELIDLNERSILIAEYMRLYNDYFVSEIQKVQDGQRDEKEVKQEIEAGLQDLTVMLEEEKAEVNDAHKKIKHFLVNLDEDFKKFNASVEEAEEYVIAQEGEIAEDLEAINAARTKSMINKASMAAMIGGGLIALGSFALFSFGVGKIVKSIAQARVGARELGLTLTETVPGLQRFIANDLKTKVAPGFGFMIIGGSMVTLGTFGIKYADSLEIGEKSEGLKGLNAELNNVNMIQHEVNAFMETTYNVTTSLDRLTNEWSTLKSNVEIMMNDIPNGSVNDLKSQFEEASVAWEKTQNASEIFRLIEEEEANSDPLDIEFNLDEINNEQEFEGKIKEIYEVDELIDVEGWTNEKYEELLEKRFRELVENEM